MLRSTMMLPATVALAVVAWLLLPLSGHEALAQSAPVYVSAVDLDISPAYTKKFLAALQENGAASVKEPGCREFDITVSQKDPNHVFVVEVYDNAAAYDAHQKTAHYGKFIALTMMMIKKYDIRPFTSVAMNMNHDATAQSGPFFVNEVELDIAPAAFDKFMDAAKENGAASVKDPGCREFNITVSQNDPHHVFFFEVYDDAAALDAHRATDHFKQFQATTKDMAVRHDVKPMSSVAMVTKGT